MGTPTPRYEEMITVEELIEDAVTSSPLPATSTPIHHLRSLHDSRGSSQGSTKRFAGMVTVPASQLAQLVQDHRLAP